MREVTSVIHPAIAVPPRDSTGPGRETVRVQVHYSFANNIDHHPSVDWNIYLGLTLFDDNGRQVAVFARAKWRERWP